MSSDEEALVPGDEDEKGLGNNMPIPFPSSRRKKRSLGQSKSKKKRKPVSPDNLFRRPTSDPQVYKRGQRIKCRQSLTTISNEESLTESCGIVQTSEQTKGRNEERLICPLSPSKKSKRDNVSLSLRQSSPTKISRIRKTSNALLRRTGTLSEIRDDRKSKSRKKVTGSENSPTAELLYSHFQMVWIGNIGFTVHVGYILTQRLDDVGLVTFWK